MPVEKQDTGAQPVFKRIGLHNVPGKLYDDIKYIAEQKEGNTMAAVIRRYMREGVERDMERDKNKKI